MKPPIVFYPAGSLSHIEVEELYQANYLPVKWEGIVQPQLKGELDLRDYFAAKAMQATLHTMGNNEQVANFAYKMADAMLLERSKNDK